VNETVGLADTVALREPQDGRGRPVEGDAKLPAVIPPRRPPEPPNARLRVGTAYVLCSFRKRDTQSTSIPVRIRTTRRFRRR